VLEEAQRIVFTAGPPAGALAVSARVLLKVIRKAYEKLGHVPMRALVVGREPLPDGTNNLHLLPIPLSNGAERATSLQVVRHLRAKLDSPLVALIGQCHDEDDQENKMVVAYMETANERRTYLLKQVGGTLGWAFTQSENPWPISDFFVPPLARKSSA